MMNTCSMAIVGTSEIMILEEGREEDEFDGKKKMIMRNLDMSGRWEPGGVEKEQG